MSGKDAVFETEIKEIRQATDIEIDDDFAKLFGMDELSALRDALKTQIEQELGQATKARLKRGCWTSWRNWSRLMFRRVCLTKSTINLPGCQC